MRPLIFISLVTLGIQLPSCLFASINIIGYDPLTNDRFVNDASFFAGGLDLSGVALVNTGQGPGFSGDDGGRWVTMLSRNVFITANHFAPGVGSSVTFHQTNSALGASFSASIEETMRIGNTDIRVGTLDVALPDGYGYYDIWNAPFSSEAPVQITGPNVLTFGRSEGDYAVTQDVAVGQNNLNLFFPSQTIGGATGDAGAMTFDDSALTYESQFGLGDSGAPVMLVVGGNLTMVGVNWFVGSIDAGATEISGFTYLPNYQSEIQTYIDGNLEMIIVPEPPASAFFLGLSALGLVFKRRRTPNVANRARGID
jgi:hypothetical protein|tara:strand:+ start:254 stop:1189 length:936 start_codon:yes stop_codon:yes gene_type:complete